VQQPSQPLVLLEVALLLLVTFKLLVVVAVVLV
jgi:hypothetical protein